jgi:hypothetical protein
MQHNQLVRFKYKKKKSKDKKTNIKKIKTKLVGLNAIWMTSKK